MRKNLPVTQHNYDYSDHIRIVSTTTDKGLITYANEDFEKVSGFNQEELIGQAHNIVRHPDMPQAAFQDLWDTAKQAQPWMGIVKNRCKNGDHYWVDAFVTELSTSDKVHKGLQSVRVKPNQATISQAEKVYNILNRGRIPDTKLHPRHWPLHLKIWIAAIFSFSPLIGASLITADLNIWYWLVIAVSLGLLTFASFILTGAYRRAAVDASRIYDNLVGRLVYTGRNDELGYLQLGIRFLTNKLHTVIWRIADSTRNIEGVANQTSQLADLAEIQSQNQLSELNQLATAMNEMSSTIEGVAESAVQASNSMNGVKNLTAKGSAQVDQTLHNVVNLTDRLSAASSKVEDINQNSSHISSLVASIHQIAEQTNLLALNAAIEAARAGEQGRGFAVVADEVRNLANNTAQTTEQIQNAIVTMQNDVEHAVEMMHEAQQESNSTTSQSKTAAKVLHDILHATEETASEMTQIATAAEQQSMVTEEINQNVHKINEFATSNSESALQAKQASLSLLTEIQKIKLTADDFSRDL